MTNDPTNVPIPASLGYDPLAAALNVKHPIADDRRIEPDEGLQGYQDDVATGDHEDELQHEVGTTPTELTLIPEPVLREELDALALDEQATTSDNESDEDRREHIEDVDENDKR